MAKHRLIAHSFVIAECRDPDCGAHFIGLDKDDNPICELVINREAAAVVIADLEEITGHRGHGTARPSTKAQEH